MREIAEAWLQQDPDPVTAAELKALIDAGDEEALAELFSARLEFGTAGLRGALGPGPMRMNRVIVAQAAAGLGRYLLERIEKPSVVIGYDARHNSEVFATDSAEILAGLGLEVFLLPEPLPTPVLAYSIRKLGVSAGVMVTASHNPPQDNGYKVYLGDGSQIVPPADEEITNQILAVGPVNELQRSKNYTILGDEIEQSYVDEVVKLSLGVERNIRCIYTPMHGVGFNTWNAVMRTAGFQDLQPVPEQRDPDPDFPTVAFPNPEEPGAMDLALELAQTTAADIIIANDPDADRCAVGARRSEEFTMLSGDEVGALLADELLRRGIKGTYAASIVSATLLGRLAKEHGQKFEQTLTGFKWIGKIPGLAFGYEEALGYDVAPHITADKDGISASLIVLELAAELKAQGMTLFDQLDAIYKRHGVHQTGQLSFRFDDLEQIESAMNKLRNEPPKELAGQSVTEVIDLANGLNDLPPTDGIYLKLGESTRIIVRPSGTEPKLKCYLQHIIEIAEFAGSDIETVKIAAKARIAELSSELREFLGL